VELQAGGIEREREIRLGVGYWVAGEKIEEIKGRRPPSKGVDESLKLSRRHDGRARKSDKRVIFKRRGEFAAVSVIYHSKPKKAQWKVD